jgi:hypothetical protein
MIGRMRRKLGLIAGISLCLVCGTVALAQTQTKPVPKPAAPAAPAKPKPQSPAKPQAAATPEGAQLAMPNAEKIVLLLRNTLISFNDAVQTGNYTVLRDRAAPGFRDANSAAKLGQIFADFASRRFDLSPVSVITPQLTENPVLDQKQGMLRLKGYFPLQPTPVAFEVLYQSVDGRWRLFGISVQPASAPQQTQAPTKMPAPPPDAN